MTTLRTVLPDNFLINDEMRIWAEGHVPQVNIDRETDVFRDYWLAHGKPMANWEACWRNWMRRAPTMGGATYSPEELRLKSMTREYTANGFRSPHYGEHSIAYEAAYRNTEGRGTARDMSSVTALVKAKRL